MASARASELDSTALRVVGTNRDDDGSMIEGTDRGTAVVRVGADVDEGRTQGVVGGRLDHRMMAIEPAP